MDWQNDMSVHDRRTRILDVTEALIGNVGNAGLTMRRIAATAEISLGNLQYHFRTREALLLALLIRFLEPFEDRFAQVPDPQGEGLEETLKQLFLEALTAPNFDPCSTIFKEIWAASSHSPDMQAALTGYYLRLAEFYRNVLAALADPGTPSVKIDRATAAMLPLLEGFCVTKTAVDSPLEIVAKDWAKMVVAILK